MTSDEFERLAKLIERERDTNLPDEGWEALGCIIVALWKMADDRRAVETNHDPE